MEVHIMNSNKTKLESLSDDRMEKVAGGVGGTTVSSGSFSSQTGTSLNLSVSWAAEADALGQKTLHVTVSSVSSNLQAAALPNSLELTVNGMTYTATPNAVNYWGGAMATHVLGGFTIPNAVGPASITAAWRFNGVIGGVQVGTITATGTAVF